MNCKMTATMTNGTPHYTLESHTPTRYVEAFNNILIAAMVKDNLSHLDGQIIGMNCGGVPVYE